MPCRSEHMEPFANEAESRRVGKLIVWIKKRLREPVLPDELKAASSIYGNTEVDLTPRLCEIVKGLKRRHGLGWGLVIAAMERDRNARDLVSWAEEHDAADKRREREEKKEQRRRVLVNSAMNKLTNDEWIAVTQSAERGLL